MSSRRIIFVFAILMCCAVPASAQEDTGAAAGPGTPGLQDTIEVAPEPATAPATTPVSPTRAAPAGADERMRSVIILVAAIILIVTLAAIIIILVRRSREGRRDERRYVAEAYLKDLSGSTTQGMYKLGNKPVMLGRVGGKDTEFLDYIVVPSATIGRRHALIEFKDFGYWIMDQGSINGTFVNGRPVSSEVRLKHGDRIRLHKAEFEFVMPELTDAGVTVVAHGAPAAAAAAAAPAESEFVLDLEPEPEAEQAVADKSAASDLDELLASVESDEATLLPGTSPPPAPPQGSAEETLLPASSGSPADETLLPPSGSEAKGGTKPARSGQRKNGDEFFDITGGD